MNHHELFDKFLHRSLTREENEKLKSLLQGDPEAGRQFVEYVGETSLLIRVGSQMQTVLETPEAAVTHATRLTRYADWWKWAALAACLMTLAASGGWWASRSSLELRATIAAVSGEVVVVRELESFPAEAGFALRRGDLVQTAPQARAAVVFDGEATRVELQDDARVRFNRSRQGKRLELSQGALEATVAPQPKGRPMTLLTLHAEARVFGTRFLLASEVSSTRLEVSQGAVEFTRRSDGRTLLVKGGLAATACPNTEFCTRQFLPSPWRAQDIGAVGLRGQARFDGTAFRVQGAGQDTCCSKDQFHFVYQPLEGDGEIRARICEVGFTDPEAKASVMIRQSLKSASPQVSLGLTAAGGLEFERRAGTESRVQRVGHSSTPCWLRLARKNDAVTASQSADGTNWVVVAVEDIPVGGRVWIGLGVTSFNHAALSTSLFDNVEVLGGRSLATPPR